MKQKSTSDDFSSFVPTNSGLSTQRTHSLLGYDQSVTNTSTSILLQFPPAKLAQKTVATRSLLPFPSLLEFSSPSFSSSSLSLPEHFRPIEDDLWPTIQFSLNSFSYTTLKLRLDQDKLDFLSHKAHSWRGYACGAWITYKRAVERRLSFYLLA